MVEHRESLDPAVHFVEPGGRGGIFHHTLAVAQELVVAGSRPVVHTAADHETLDVPGVELCGCVNWHRTAKPAAWRACLVAGDYLLRTQPHLVRETRSGVAHVQGLFQPPLYAWTIDRLARRSRRVIFSPHNTFSRAARGWEEVLLRRSCRRASATVAFSHADCGRLSGWGDTPILCDLVMHVPPVDVTAVSTWRQRMQAGSSDPVAAVIGQIRPDKGVDEFLRAMTQVPRPASIAVVGEDRGSYRTYQTLARDLDLRVQWIVGYLPLTDFVAAIAAADVVVAPYAQASQSAILSIATQVGTTTVAYPVGGLRDYATLTTDGSDVQSLARGIDRAFDLPARGTHLSARASFAPLYGQS